MKKQLRAVLFAVLVLCMLTVTAIAASAATPFTTGGKSYATLEEAVAAVADGGTVTVTESVTLNADIVLAESKTYTIAGATGSEVITFTNSTTLGNIQINAGTVTFENLSVLAQSSNAVIVSNKGTTLTIESGSYKSSGSTDATGCSVAVGGYATLNINDGTFVGAIGPYSSSAAAGSYITVNGGTFSQNPSLMGGGYYARLFNANRAGTNITINGGNFTYVTNSTSASAGIYISSVSASVTVNAVLLTAAALTKTRSLKSATATLPLWMMPISESASLPLR